MAKEKTEVDAVTKNALLEMETSIVKAVTKIIKDSNDQLEKTLRELHDLRFKNIEEQLARSFKHHEEHYKAIRELKEKEHSDHEEIKNSVSTQLEELRKSFTFEVEGIRNLYQDLEKRQSRDEGREEGKTFTESLGLNKKTVAWTAAGVLVALLAVYFGGG